MPNVVFFRGLALVPHDNIYGAVVDTHGIKKVGAVFVQFFSGCNYANMVTVTRRGNTRYMRQGGGFLLLRRQGLENTCDINSKCK